MEDLLALHRRAMDDLVAIVASVGDADLARATPCADWDVADLLAHCVGQHRGFAAAVRDGAAPASAYLPVAYDEQTWLASVEELLAAFDGAADDAEVLQVELHPTQRLPVQALVGAQLLDAAVHGWDVARSLGRDHRPDADQVARILRMAERIPDDAGREAPGAAFGHVVAGAGVDWERLLRVVGRDPDWSPVS